MNTKNLSANIAVFSSLSMVFGGMAMSEQKSVEDIAQEALSCIVDGCRGIYAGQSLGRILDPLPNVEGVTQEDVDILLAGPDHEFYDETLSDVLDQIEWTDDDGNTFGLHMDGDIFEVNQTLIDQWESETGLNFWEEWGC